MAQWLRSQLRQVGLNIIVFTNSLCKMTLQLATDLTKDEYVAVDFCNYFGFGAGLTDGKQRG